MNIYKEIEKERLRQDEMWGEQNHPCLNQALMNRQQSCSSDDMCANYEIPSETRARFLSRSSFKKGEGTFAHIALEEFAEVISELDINKRRIELIQLTAVCVAWLESIDRQIS
ncbi:hypothetical protein [Winogradskyella haliclonae]|uniref:Uncharacterized protein n=1 Tax=Winogradskyella haliclonae TaxID=2048558 RepID=A0ABQ2C367_9FLAO|nr:hypothetical protein [Winogradskyella haliclonae]GGI57563.1 hypothetical protein GCM10011444_18720 [Winogradskyella haliclonae]